MQIKEGDKVRILKSVCPSILHVGDEVIVERIVDDHIIAIKDHDGREWIFMESDVELVEPTEEKPDSTFYRVIITGCSNPRYWYANAIGDIYDVEKINGVYSVDYARYILIQDAEIVEETKEYIEMRGVKIPTDFDEKYVEFHKERYDNLILSNTEKEESPKKTNTEDLIIQECDAIKELLLQKNKRYGDSATKRGVVYDLDPVIAIQARINDKISRLKNQHGEDEDVELDLMGYFILLRIAKKMKQ